MCHHHATLPSATMAAPTPSLPCSWQILPRLLPILFPALSHLFSSLSPTPRSFSLSSFAPFLPSCSLSHSLIQLSLPLYLREVIPDLCWQMGREEEEGEPGSSGEAFGPSMGRAPMSPGAARDQVEQEVWPGNCLSPLASQTLGDNHGLARTIGDSTPLTKQTQEVRVCKSSRGRSPRLSFSLGSGCACREGRGMWVCRPLNSVLHAA